MKALMTTSMKVAPRRICELFGLVCLMVVFAGLSGWFGATSGGNPSLGWRLRPGVGIIAILGVFCSFAILSRRESSLSCLVVAVYLSAISSEYLQLPREHWIVIGSCLTVMGFSLFYLQSRRIIAIVVVFLCGTYILSVFLYNCFLLTQRMNFLAAGWTT